jgi:NADPH2:quinone reductase
MKAAWYTKNGAARDVLVVGELPTPEPGPGEVLVKISRSGINPSDVKSRKSRPLDAEHIVPHSDGGGVIHCVGAGVSEKRVGQRVWLWNGQWQRPMGTAAEFIALPQSQAVALPSNIDFDVAACLGIPALTALQAVHLAGPLEGKTVLVTGAGNVVGNYITQLAVHRGAIVIGTAGSAPRQSHASEAGASHVLNYKSEAIAERVKQITAGHGVDAIIDMDFASTAGLLGQGALKAHGAMVTYGSNSVGAIPIDYRAMLFGSFGIKAFLVYDLDGADREIITAELTALLESNSLAHKVGATFSLDEIALAHEAVESGTNIGSMQIVM